MDGASATSLCSDYSNLAVHCYDSGCTILAFSADPEGLFSGAAITINKRRDWLVVGLVEASESLKSWYKGKGTAWAVVFRTQ